MSDTVTGTLYLDVLSISAAIRHAKVLREKQLTGDVRLCCPVGSIRRRRKERSVEMEPQGQQVFEGLGRVDLTEEIDVELGWNSSCCCRSFM